MSPSARDLSETKSTLSFGSRAMKITNTAYVNMEVGCVSVLVFILSYEEDQCFHAMEHIYFTFNASLLFIRSQVRIPLSRLLLVCILNCFLWHPFRLITNDSLIVFWKHLKRKVRTGKFSKIFLATSVLFMFH